MKQLTNKEIEDWAQKETDEHFKNYFKKEDGTEMHGEEISGEMMADYLIEMSTYRFGLTKGAKSYRDNQITN